MAGRVWDDPEVVRNAEGPRRGLLVSAIGCWEIGLGDAGILLSEIFEDFLKILLDLLVMVRRTSPNLLQTVVENTFHVIKDGLKLFGRFRVVAHSCFPKMRPSRKTKPFLATQALREGRGPR